MGDIIKIDDRSEMPGRDHQAVICDPNGSPPLTSNSARHDPAEVPMPSNRARQIRMTTSQHWTLCSADEAGRLAVTDLRIIRGLLRRGWVEERTQRKRRWWVISPAGRTALDSSPEIIRPRIRPDWRGLEYSRHSPGHYAVEGHDLIRPQQGMLWRIVCAQHKESPIAHASTLTEAVELLVGHLFGENCKSRTQAQANEGRNA